MKTPTVAITHAWEANDGRLQQCAGSVMLDELARLLTGGRVACGVCWNRLDPADWAEDDNLPVARPLRIKAIPPEDGA